MEKLKQLLAKRDALIGRLCDYKYILRGTVIKRGNICGKPNCRCKRKGEPTLHGPYSYLSHRSMKTTNMIFLNKKKLKFALRGIMEYQQLIKLIYQISEMNFKALRYHYDKLPSQF